MYVLHAEWSSCQPRARCRLLPVISGSRSPPPLHDGVAFGLIALRRYSTAMEAQREVLDTQRSIADGPPSNADGDDVRNSQPEVALDSDEKIELEAFLQRKEWIEEKCMVRVLVTGAQYQS
jgi:hypothetical protein